MEHWFVSSRATGVSMNLLMTASKLNEYIIEAVSMYNYQHSRIFYSWIDDSYRKIYYINTQKKNG